MDRKRKAETGEEASAFRISSTYRYDRKLKLQYFESDIKYKAGK
ncbi:hypothetical protein [Faecalicatena fissicatena]|nr:hypothetical protein [Faecalicatena fissicatena]